MLIELLARFSFSQPFYLVAGGLNYTLLAALPKEEDSLLVIQWIRLAMLYEQISRKQLR